MEQSPKLQLSYIAPAQAQKHVPVNESLRRLDQLCQQSVQSRALTQEPTTPTEGDAYILPFGANGDAWGTFTANNIAAFQDGAWNEIVVAEGFRAWVNDDNALIAFNGTGWVGIGGGGGGTPPPITETVPRFGINTAADNTNRLFVKSDAVLFSHDDETPGTGDLRIIANKALADGNVSHIFQTNFSARAEFGLAGDDDFHMRVSPDGTNFIDSLLIDHTSGDISFERNIATKGFCDLSEITVPSAPSASTARLYARDDGGVTRLAMRDASGNETLFGAGGSGGGEANTTSNAGTGTGLAKAKSGVDLPIKSLVAGSNVTIDDSVDEITISASVSGGGGGTVDTSGAPTTGDFARFSGTTTLEGRSVSEVRSDLGLNVGADVQGQNARLQNIADTLSADSGLVEKTSANTFGVITVTPAAKALLNDVDSNAQRATLGLGVIATKATIATADIDNDAVTFAKVQAIASGRILGRTSAGAGDIEELNLLDEDDFASDSAGAIATQQSIKAYIDAREIPIGIAVSDETTALTVGAAATTFRMPFGFILTGVRASLSTAQTNGSVLTVDINQNGNSVLSTKLTIDNSEKSSVSAVSQAAIATAALADDAEITVDIDQLGTGASGLKIWLIGRRA